MQPINECSRFGSCFGRHAGPKGPSSLLYDSDSEREAASKMEALGGVAEEQPVATVTR